MAGDGACRLGKYSPGVNRMFRDKNLSWAARGVMGYLLSDPDEGEPREVDLYHPSVGERDKMRAILGELEAQGYIHLGGERP